MSPIVDLSAVMSSDDLLSLRKGLAHTQAEMADAMGLSKSAYVAIETGAATMRKIHQLAAERVALAHASNIKNPLCAPASVQRDAVRLAKAIKAMVDAQ